MELSLGYYDTILPSNLAKHTFKLMGSDKKPGKNETTRRRDP